MKPIKFKIVPHKIASQCYDPVIPKSWLDVYGKSNPTALEKIDIFQKNGRELNQVYTRFDFFEESNDPEIYVSPYYLELFEFAGYGHLIPDYVKELCDLYKDNIVVFQWNHDNDFSLYSSRISKINNARVINFGNTQSKKNTDILVPFWNYNTSLIKNSKKVFCSFVGSINNQTRLNLSQSILNHGSDDFVFRQNVPIEEFLNYLSSTLFSLCPKGGPGNGGFSYRFFQCMHLNTIPVLMVDRLIFPYPDLDWESICVRLPENMVDIEEIRNNLNKVDTEKMLSCIEEHRMRFTLGGVQEEVYKHLK
jgi:hypothetical protein